MIHALKLHTFHALAYHDLRFLDTLNPKEEEGGMETAIKGIPIFKEQIIAVHKGKMSKNTLM